jgi:hypothetical protein
MRQLERSNVKTSIGSVQVAAMRHTRNELAMMHENLHGKNELKKINLFGFTAKLFGSK